MDKLALWEIGIKNVISVPNGANDKDDVWENSEIYLSSIKKFYIATDCDEKGQILSEKIAQRLGRWRCLRVVFKNKDANDDLIEGRTVLEDSVASARPYPLSGTYTVEDLFDPIMKLYENGTPETIYPKKDFFGPMKEVFSTMRGHLVTVTGIPSHGKSNFVDWYVLNLINDHNLKASWFSPEHHPMSLHQTTFIEKVTGKPFDEEKAEKLGCERVSFQEILRYKEWANERIYLTGPEGSESPTWKWLLGKFKEQMYSYGIDIFVVDAFNKVLFDKKGNKLDLVSECLTELTSFAQRNNVIIFLVAHLTNHAEERKNRSLLWSVPSTRRKLLEELSDKGYSAAQLEDLKKVVNGEDSDLFDVLAYIAYHRDLVPRLKRAERAKIQLGTYNPAQQEFLNFVLDQYVTSGVEQLDDSQLGDLLVLKYHALVDAKAQLGDIPYIRKTFIGFQQHLYGERVGTIS